MADWSLDLSRHAVGSIADIVRQVRQKVAEIQPGEWIRGRGWDRGYLAEGRYPHKEDLDEVSPENPVVFTEWSGHAIWANSKALETAGITRETPNPEGGEIARDGDGEPTGLLLETAMQMLTSQVPKLSDEEIESSARAAMEVLHSQGVTPVTTRDIGDFYDVAVMLAAQLEDAGMNIELVVTDWPTVTDSWDDPEAFEILTMGSPHQVLPLTHSWLEPGGQGLMEDENLIAAMEAFTSAADDQEAQESAEEIAAAYSEYLPIFKVADHSRITALDSELEGYQYAPGGGDVFWNMRPRE